MTSNSGKSSTDWPINISIRLLIQGPHGSYSVREYSQQCQTEEHYTGTWKFFIKSRWNTDPIITSSHCVWRTIEYLGASNHHTAPGSWIKPKVLTSEEMEWSPSKNSSRAFKITEDLSPTVGLPLCWGDCGPQCLASKQARLSYHHTKDRWFHQKSSRWVWKQEAKKIKRLFGDKNNTKKHCQIKRHHHQKQSNRNMNLEGNPWVRSQVRQFLSLSIKTRSYYSSEYFKCPSLSSKEKDLPSRGFYFAQNH